MGVHKVHLGTPIRFTQGKSPREMPGSAVHHKCLTATISQSAMACAATQDMSAEKKGIQAHPVPFPASSLLETSELRKEQYPGKSPTCVLNAARASSLSAPPGQWLVIWHA